MLLFFYRTFKQMSKRRIWSSNSNEIWSEFCSVMIQSEIRFTVTMKGGWPIPLSSCSVSKKIFPKENNSFLIYLNFFILFISNENSRFFSSHFANLQASTFLFSCSDYIFINKKYNIRYCSDAFQSIHCWSDGIVSSSMHFLEYADA